MGPGEIKLGQGQSEKFKFRVRIPEGLPPSFSVSDAERSDTKYRGMIGCGCGCNEKSFREHQRSTLRGNVMYPTSLCFAFLELFCRPAAGIFWSVRMCAEDENDITRVLAAANFQKVCSCLTFLSLLALFNPGYNIVAFASIAYAVPAIP